jgi:hypothetical protein
MLHDYENNKYCLEKIALSFPYHILKIISKGNFVAMLGPFPSGAARVGK